MQFIFKLIASFLVGGLYVAFITRTAEKVGPKVGGVLAGLPSTALISLIFIALTQNQAAAVSAVRAIPAGFGFSVLLVALYIYWRQSKTITASMVPAVGVWLSLAVLLVWFVPKSLILSTLIFAICFFISVKSLEKHPTVKTPRYQVRTSELLLRAAVAGMLIALTVLIAKVTGPFIGGVVASFPVVVVTSLTMLDNRRGRDLTTATAKNIPYGALGTVAFLVAFHSLVPRWGMVWGLIVSYIIAVIAAVLVMELRKKLPAPGQPVIPE